MANVAFIGLGVMGFPMAGHLVAKGGHAITVYNRSRQKVERWLEAFPKTSTAATPAEAARKAEFVFSCVGNDNDLRAVTTGPEGAFNTMSPGSVFIDHTTASAEVSRELAEAANERGIHFLDAPVSGGQAGAENGRLTVMVGGDQQAFEKSEPLISCFSQMVTLIGPSGSGQLAKMVNQIAICGVLQSLSEAISFAQHAGLDLDRVMNTIDKGAAQSWQMENRWQTMAKREFDFGFAVDWMRKDLSICLNEAQKNGARLSVAKLVDGYYDEIQNMGGGRWDTSSLIARLPKHST